VIARFGRRLLEGLVALFALLGFAFVPLGEHTGLEHLKAIASTPAAERAARELVQAGAQLRQRLTRALLTSQGTRKKSALPELTEPDLRPEPENARIAPASSTLDASAPWQTGG
jgi:hypothetical protein